MSHPPRNGPAAVATPPSPAHAPIALARSSRVKDACRMAKLPGVRRAAPIPWSARAPIKASALGATPQRSEASANQAVPIWNSRRRP